MTMTAIPAANIRQEACASIRFRVTFFETRGWTCAALWIGAMARASVGGLLPEPYSGTAAQLDKATGQVRRGTVYENENHQCQDHQDEIAPCTFLKGNRIATVLIVLSRD